MQLKPLLKERDAQYRLLKSIKRFPDTYPDKWEELTRSQKAHFYRKKIEYSDVVTSAGRFVARKVTSKTTIKNLAEAGFDVKNGVVIIPRDGVTDKVTVSAKQVLVTHPDGSYRRFLLGSKFDALNLTLPKMREGERIGLNLGNGNTNGSRDAAAFQKNYSVPSGMVSRDSEGNSWFTGNEGDNMKVHGWVISTLETVFNFKSLEERLAQEKKEKEIKSLARKMRLNFTIGR